jgi:iron(III) transport system permease protein
MAPTDLARPLSGSHSRIPWDRIRSNWVVILVIAFMLFLILVPIIRLIVNSFILGHPSVPEGWTLSNYTSAFRMPIFYSALWTTIWIAGIGTSVTLAIAVLFAWLIERTDMPFRNLAWTLILVPMAIPGVLFALGWTLLLSPKIGAMNIAIQDLLAIFGITVKEGPINIYTVGGLIFLDGLRGVTTVFLMIVGSFRMMDPTLEEAARAAKAGTAATFFQITLPAMMPAVLAAGMYSFISSMESFEAPLAVGLQGNIFVLSPLIYFTPRIQAPIDYGLAAVFGVSFMVLMMLLLLLYRRVVRQNERFSTITGKGFRPRITSIGKWRYPALAMFVVYFVLAVVLPFGILLWTSFLPSYRIPSWEALNLFSWRNYTEIFETDRVLSVVWNTLVLMLVAATLTMLLSFVTSWGIVRSQSRGSGFLDGLVFMPHAIPGIVIALALIMAYLSPPLKHLHIYGSIWIMVIGMVVSYVAFGTRLMNSAIMQVQKELEQAAYVAGAGTMKTLMVITLPLLFPAFAAGWVWVAVHALRSFSIPLMLASHENEVFAVLLWEYWEEGSASLSSALGVLMILVLIPLTLLMRRFIVQVSGQQG